jgi:hypothetical protein
LRPVPMVLREDHFWTVSLTLIPAACSVGGLGFEESPGRELAPCASQAVGAFSVRLPGGKCAPELPPRYPHLHMRLLMQDNTVI